MLRCGDILCKLQLCYLQRNGDKLDSLTTTSDRKGCSLYQKLRLHKGAQVAKHYFTSTT